MGLSIHSQLIIPEDGIVVLGIDRKNKEVKLIVDCKTISFVKRQDGKVEWVSKDNGRIPKKEYNKAVRKVYAILRND